MVVISASICTKAGKIVVSRQFVPITRIKLEEYIANFPKLIETGKFLPARVRVLIPCRKVVHSHRDGKHPVRLSAH